MLPLSEPLEKNIVILFIVIDQYHTGGMTIEVNAV